MRITLRRGKSDDWQVIDSVDFAKEHELQDLLHESPSLIPLGQIAPGTPTPVFAVAELGLPGSGNTDIVAFSEDGSISIVECKLAKNAEIRRKVIGQILEYAAFLWEMSYEELDERVQRQADGPLAEMIAETVADEDWDEEAFRHAIGSNLREGQFILRLSRV